MRIGELTKTHEQLLEALDQGIDFVTLMDRPFMKLYGFSIAEPDDHDWILVEFIKDTKWTDDEGRPGNFWDVNFYRYNTEPYFRPKGAGSVDLVGDSKFWVVLSILSTIKTILELFVTASRPDFVQIDAATPTHHRFYVSTLQRFAPEFEAGGYKIVDVNGSIRISSKAYIASLNQEQVA